MALGFEVKFDGNDVADFGFTVIRQGIKGRDQLGGIRSNLEYIPGVDDALDFGSDYSMRNIYVTGWVTGTSRTLLLQNIALLKALVDIGTYAYKKLQFGDEITGDCCYEAVYNGTFIVEHIGSTLTAKNILVTIGFLVKKDKVAA